MATTSRGRRRRTILHLNCSYEQVALLSWHTGSGLSKPDLWAHSSAVTICAKMVAERIFAINGDDAFLCGILHDLGLLVEEHLHPLELSEICNSCQTISSLLELEKQAFKTDHCEICHTITLAWHMPATIQKAILNHHQITDDIDPTSLVGIIQIAEYICDHLEYKEIGNVTFEMSPSLSNHLQENQDEHALLLEDLPDEIEKAQTLFQ
ncbi:MAG: HDOD domain-containing protein [Bacteroidetes bacterium]|nr:HDOD domain-containing protein [Bacteroidota bacterium]